ncbi:mitochondrial import inner membrane translocase subunit TIM50-C-like [Pollicipes pollicipes]|uniref:mitochondrial import inner membrane translocase subunit TIM50-C-like n=1 Tax=Pollicipes pollicipes TaxID=41117 RepID=UPI0018849C7E|nr:mitochondrial import inner membrane translocase subunit TIM50-C-like [Pollicipes pollicipes]XP_037072374.1 mitochondrial import inner membrane translocase subunit TIM50-C-like [Pollicipes pollicipes]
MAAGRCAQLAASLSGLSRLSHQAVCRTVAGPRLDSQPLLRRLGASLLKTSTVALYSTGKGGSEGSKLTGFTSTPAGSGLADEILSAKVKAEESQGKTGGDGKQSDGGQKSEDERAEEEKRKEASWRAMKYTFAFFGVTLAGFSGWTIAVFGAPIKDPEGNVMYDEFSDMSFVTQYLSRTWKELKLYNKMIKDPSRAQLLPDPLQYPYMQPPYTLVLEMTGVLVHPDWTYKTGWRFKKRPGIDFFLQQVGPPLFEVVVYTAEQGFTASPIVDALDPQGYVMYRLFKDSTRYVNSHHVKDLNCLNRDLSKVIMVDWNDKSVQLNPRNHLRVKKWAGNDDDRSLVDLAMLLKAVATSGVGDVREVMDFYRQYDDPLQAFRENQRRLQEQEEAMQRHRAEEESKGALVKKSWTFSLLRR